MKPLRMQKSSAKNKFKKNSIENLSCRQSLTVFKIQAEAKANHSSGTRSISPPRKLPLALSLAPLEIKIFQETLVARLPRRPSERLAFTSFAGVIFLGFNEKSLFVFVNQWQLFEVRGGVGQFI